MSKDLTRGYAILGGNSTKLSPDLDEGIAHFLIHSLPLKFHLLPEYKCPNAPAPESLLAQVNFENVSECPSQQVCL